MTTHEDHVAAAGSNPPDAHLSTAGDGRHLSSSGVGGVPVPAGDSRQRDEIRDAQLVERIASRLYVETHDDQWHEASRGTQAFWYGVAACVQGDVQAAVEARLRQQIADDLHDWWQTLPNDTLEGRDIRNGIRMAAQRIAAASLGRLS